MQKKRVREVEKWKKKTILKKRRERNKDKKERKNNKITITKQETKDT